MNLNTESVKKNTFDAIVVGSGMAGGWAAKELTEKGLKTLVLERGKDVPHITGYPTAMMRPWDFEHRGRLNQTMLDENPVIARCYAYNEGTEHFFVKDTDHPYVQEKPFDWIRGYQVGGKSLLWARQVQRWSDYDFEGPARDGYAVDWPIRYKDLAPWYSYVEKFAGVSGNKDGIPHLPDGEFMPPMELNVVETHLQQKIAQKYTDRQLIIGRAAHLTDPQKVHLDAGRGQCQRRDLCYRGCPFGAYFSANSSTLPAAAKTGKMTLAPNMVVQSIIYDDRKGKATGVMVFNKATQTVVPYYAKVIFVSAAALNTNALLLNSTSARFPAGFGNDSGVLGQYVGFHLYRARAGAEIDGFDDKYYLGKRPSGLYIPRFRNVAKQETDFLRGYAISGSAGRAGWGRHVEGFGKDLKDKLTEPGPWSIYLQQMGETIPKATNFVSLDRDQKDAWGMPLLKTNIGYDENDEKQTKDFLAQAREMLTNAGFKNIWAVDSKQSPGLDIHEMGGVRMGKDPKTSMLNEWNQTHACKNVFVTDGASMTSMGTQNPSLTFMALTARAANHAVEEMKKGNI